MNILIIVPCYNEEHRLKKDSFLNQTPKNVDILFADDGSKDNTLSLVKDLCQSRSGFYYFHAQKNNGKAQIIHDAFQFYSSRLQTDFKDKNYTWIGFWDADLATPLSEITYFISYQQMFSPHSLVLFGSRVARYGAKIERSQFRHYLSRLFVTFTDLLLGIKAYDTQCGAKLFHSSISEKTFKEPFISKWIFDIEFVLRLGKEIILEVPVFEWKEVPGSKMKIGRESFRILSDLIKIRNHYLKR